VSIIGLDDGRDHERRIDGQLVESISADLASGLSLNNARRIELNSNMSFMGVTPAGAFDVDFRCGMEMLTTMGVHGRPNSDVIRPYINGRDINQRPRGQWTIDFGVDTALQDAAFFEVPFEYVQKN